MAPSAIPHPVFEVRNETIVPKEMTLDDIRATTAAFAAAAVRAQTAGFDCVEIHAAHGYLISQFLTPFENRRVDAYGGSLENRARFGLDILRAVKAAVPMPVIYRISVDDYFPAGVPYADGRQVALWAAQAGADALHIAAGHYRSLPSGARMIPPMAYPDATFLGYAADIKRQVRVPVIAVGRLGDAADGRRSGRERQGRFHRARPHAHRRAGVGREAPPRRAGAALPRLQHLRRRDARRIAVALRGQRRSRPGGSLSDGVAADRRAHRRDRRRSRRPDLCLAGRRPEQGHGFRTRRQQPAVRSARPARRRCSRTWSPTSSHSTAMCAIWWQPVRTKA